MPSCAPRLMLSVVSLYGLLPVDLRSTAAVPRLNAQLLTSLGAAHPDWELLAISPEAKPLPGVETIGVALPASAGQAAAVRAASGAPPVREEGGHPTKLWQVALGRGRVGPAGRLPTRSALDGHHLYPCRSGARRPPGYAWVADRALDQNGCRLGIG